MKNILKPITSFRIGYDWHANINPLPSPSKSGSEKHIVINADRSTQSESIGDRGAHFVLGYN